MKHIVDCFVFSEPEVVGVHLLAHRKRLLGLARKIRIRQIKASLSNEIYK